MCTSKKAMLVLTTALPALFTACSSANDSSLGIIGGADGPTVIYTTGFPSYLRYGIIGIILLAGLAVFLFKRKKN